MDEREMFEQSFKRPSNYFDLSPEGQWRIDSHLGILDWKGENLSKEDLARFKAHYKSGFKRDSIVSSPSAEMEREMASSFTEHDERENERENEVPRPMFDK